VVLDPSGAARDRVGHGRRADRAECGVAALQPALIERLEPRRAEAFMGLVVLVFGFDLRVLELVRAPPRSTAASTAGCTPVGQIDTFVTSVAG